MFIKNLVRHGKSRRRAAPGKVVDYSFDVKSIRGPIEDMLSQNGWKLSLVTLRKDATYKKKGWFS